MVLNMKGDRSMERLSRDCGGRPSAAALQKMVSSDLKAFPDVETIRGLSRGLGAPVQEIIFACARSVGLQVAGESDDTLPITGGRNLPKSSQDALLTIAKDLIEAQAAVDHRSYDLAAREEDPEVGAQDIERTT